MKTTAKILVLFAMLSTWTHAEQPTGKITCDNTLAYDKAIYTGERRIIETLSLGTVVSIEGETGTTIEYRVRTPRGNAAYIAKSCIAMQSRSSRRLEEPHPTISAIDLKAEGQFPNFYVRALRVKGDIPGWANYVCFDPDPHLDSSYFLLVAYSPKPVSADASKLGVVKGVTYQEYIGDTPVNLPPSIDELQKEMSAIKAGDGIPVTLFNLLNAVLQARDNFGNTAVADKALLGSDFEKTLASVKDPHIVWTVQKYTNAMQAGGLLPRIDESQLEKDSLGFVLYEVSPGANAFHTADSSETSSAEDLIMQPTNDGLFFTFSPYAKGIRTMPQHGRCESIK